MFWLNASFAECYEVLTLVQSGIGTLFRNKYIVSTCECSIIWHTRSKCKWPSTLDMIVIAVILPRSNNKITSVEGIVSKALSVLSLGTERASAYLLQPRAPLVVTTTTAFIYV